MIGKPGRLQQIAIRTHDSAPRTPTGRRHPHRPHCSRNLSRSSVQIRKKILHVHRSRRKRHGKHNKAREPANALRRISITQSRQRQRLDLFWRRNHCSSAQKEVIPINNLIGPWQEPTRPEGSAGRASWFQPTLPATPHTQGSARAPMPCAGCGSAPPPTPRRHSVTGAAAASPDPPRS